MFLSEKKDVYPSTNVLWKPNREGTKREENEFHKTPRKWTYNFSIFNFILLHSFWNDALEIWWMYSVIKSHSLKESGPCQPLVKYIPTFRY